MSVSPGANELPSAVPNVPRPFDGVDLALLAERHGTPLYVYDARGMRQQLGRFLDAFAGVPARVWFAAKSLSNVAVLRLFRSLGAGLDAVSLEEIDIGHYAGFSPSTILFTPNCVHFAEIAAAVSRGVRVNLENLQHLEEFGRTYGGSVPCGLRIQPLIAFEGLRDDARTWYAESKFGISLDFWQEARAIIARHRMNVEGLHIHSSSMILDAEIFARAARLLLDLAGEMDDVVWIDLGGGIRVPYSDEDTVLDLDALGDELRAVWHDRRGAAQRVREVRFEPGRFLVSENGVLLTRAAVVKSNGHVDIAGVDSGFHHLIRPMLYGAYHRITNLSNPQGVVRPYTVVGNLCERDTFARSRSLPEVRPGDLIAFSNAGAYGYTMASNYNSRPRPAEVLVDVEGSRIIRRRETLVDLLRGQIDLASGESLDTEYRESDSDDASAPRAPEQRMLET
jgi:diaminopimelate decarboxylase